MPMIEARVTGATLEVVLTGLDSVLAANRTSWTFSVPIEHVVRTEQGPPRGFAQKRHVNLPGSDRKRYGGRLICAHRRAPVLYIELDTYPYHELILSVPDPGRTADEIQRALPGGGR
jgi:hypothetical protein